MFSWLSRFLKLKKIKARTSKYGLSCVKLTLTGAPVFTRTVMRATILGTLCCTHCLQKGGKFAEKSRVY